LKGKKGKRIEAQTLPEGLEKGNEEGGLE